MQSHFSIRIVLTALIIVLVINIQASSILALNDSPAAENVRVQNKLTGLSSSKAVPGEYIVVFKDGLSNSHKQQIITKHSFKERKDMKIINAKLVSLPDGIYPLSQKNNQLNELVNDPMVEYIEPNYRLVPMESSISNDPYADQLWGLKNYGQLINKTYNGLTGIDINLEPAWQITRGNSDVVVAVIDSGIDISHPDLKDSIWSNPDEIADGKDNDGNLLIDDLYGWDFFYGDNSVYHNSTEDYHGTHCAGTIAAKPNDIGIVGVAPGVKIMPLKFIGWDPVAQESYGETADAISAIEYAQSKGVKIVNCSWGGADNSAALYEAMAESGMLFITAAGNDTSDNDAKPLYPACFEIPNNISVAAINCYGQLADFSNYGASAVDVAAPGALILSTIPDNSYGYSSGTSMAAPHVSGIAALILSTGITDIAAIKAKILDSARQHPLGLSDKILTGGLVDARKTFNLPPVADNPRISGTLKVGQVLSAAYEYSDPEQDSEGTSIIQWYRADSAAGENMAEIVDANHSSYTLTADDVNKYICFSVTPVSSSGISPGAKVYSPALPINQSRADECFIATAAFGSKMAPAVKLLRLFRDEYLLTNPWGAAFVKFYYHHSPPLARFIADSEVLRALCRILLAPFIAGVYLLYHKALFLLCIIVIMLAVYYRSHFRGAYPSRTFTG